MKELKKQISAIIHETVIRTLEMVHFSIDTHSFPEIEETTSFNKKQVDAILNLKVDGIPLKNINLTALWRKCPSCKGGAWAMNLCYFRIKGNCNASKAYPVPNCSLWDLVVCKFQKVWRKI